MCIQRIYLPIGWRVYLPVVKFVSCLVFSWQGQTTVFICLTGERQIIPDYPGRSTSPTRLRITSPRLRRDWVLSAAPCWLGPNHVNFRVLHIFWPINSESVLEGFSPLFTKKYFLINIIVIKYKQEIAKDFPFFVAVLICGNRGSGKP